MTVTVTAVSERVVRPERLIEHSKEGDHVERQEYSYDHLGDCAHYRVLATGASGEKNAGTANSSGDSTLKGLGARDASGDVAGGQIVREGDASFEIVYAQVTITNTSSEASDYFVTLAVESPDGTIRIDDTMVSVMALAPGQNTTEKGMLLKDIPADAVVKVIEVQRTSSV